MNPSYALVQSVGSWRIPIAGLRRRSRSGSVATAALFTGATFQFHPPSVLRQAREGESRETVGHRGNYRRAVAEVYRHTVEGRDQCWAGINRKNTRGYGYPSNQERTHRYCDGYDMCSRILGRVESNTRAMPDETHGCIHVCQD